MTYPPCVALNNTKYFSALVSVMNQRKAVAVMEGFNLKKMRSGRKTRARMDVRLVGVQRSLSVNLPVVRYQQIKYYDVVRRKRK